VVTKAVADRYAGTDEDAVDDLDAMLKRAVRIRMEADVPLGAFLSGGIDSSAVVACMQAQSAKPIKTFTIGFADESYNEAPYARSVADHLGTDHTELIVSPEEAMAVVPRLPALYDEPFGDSSQIAAFLVSQLARKHVKVSLSGDGGDELFGGYNRYPWGERLWRRFGWMPRPIKNAAAGLLGTLSPAAWDQLFRRVAPLLPERLRVARAGVKAQKFADALRVARGEDTPEGLYYRIVSLTPEPGHLVRGAKEPPTMLTDRAAWPALDSLAERMMYLDLLTYLPGDILAKVDRATMGVSLEGRVPFLDHNLVEFAWRLPPSLKIRQGVGKWPLRQVLYRLVPPSLLERPKMGFSLPIAEWLRGPLRAWAEDLLGEPRIKAQGYLDPKMVRRRWESHLSGARNHESYLWTVLMFQAWLA
jgi:asparagine synthase (glutamine-hydrolysing)